MNSGKFCAFRSLEHPVPAFFVAESGNFQQLTTYKNSTLSFLKDNFLGFFPHDFKPNIP
jgi:hypothetical protein